MKFKGYTESGIEENGLSEPSVKMKNSGIEWLGIMPKYWGVKRLKYVAKIQFSGVDKKSNKDELDVLLCNYVDVYKNEYIDDSIDFMKATASEKEFNKFRIEEGDILVTKDSETPFDIAVPAFVKKNFLNVLCGYHLAQIKADKKIIHPEYLFWLFQSKSFNAQFVVSANGITRFGLGTDSFENVFIPVMPVNEQKKIADFLDHKTSQIDNLIEEKEKLLKLLEEKRIALITKAVTKGLDPEVKMKPSGIEWLGDVPEHWEVKRLKYVAKINPKKSEIRLDLNENVSFVPMESINEYGGMSTEQIKTLEEVYSGYTYFIKDDIVVAKITPCFENGKGSVAENLENNIGFGTTELHVLRASIEIETKFLMYITYSYTFRNFGTSEMLGAGGQKRVPEEFLRNFIVYYPQISEQKKIVSRLELELNKISRLSKSIIAVTDLLKEYRTSLITSAVTGKIDVRGGLKIESELSV